MLYKKYKPGDRIFYKNFFNDNIETGIVLKVQDQKYTSEKGYDVNYQLLTLWESENGNCSSCIENYSCLPQNSPEYKEASKKYRLFDLKKDSIIDSLMNIIGKWDKPIQEDILSLLELKIR